MCPIHTMFCDNNIKPLSKNNNVTNLATRPPSSINKKNCFNTQTSGLSSRVRRPLYKCVSHAVTENRRVQTLRLNLGNSN